MKLLKLTAVSAIVCLGLSQSLIAQAEENKNNTTKGTCPAKIERTREGGQGMQQLWTALKGCLSDGGYVGIDDLKNSWEISYINDISLIGGARIADYDDKFLSLRIENRKLSMSEGQAWARDQFGVGLRESSSSELSISLNNNAHALSYVNIKKDLEQMGFKEIPVAVRPEMIIYSKNEGLTKVAVYIVSPVEAATEVVSLRFYGFK
jgi:hypothetical protein